MPAVLSSDGECIACVADGAMPDEFRSGDVLVGKRIVDFGAVDTDGLTPYVFALRSGGLMVRRVIADKISRRSCFLSRAVPTGGSSRI